MLRTREVRRTRPGGSVVLASVGLHAVVALAFWALGIDAEPPLPPLEVYRVNIVSPPPAELGPPVPVQAAEVDQAEPEPTAPEPEPEPSPDPAPVKPDPDPEPDPDPVVTQPSDPEPEPSPPSEPDPPEEPRSESAAPARGVNPDPDSDTSGEGVNVRIDGEAFPYPDYLSNIAIQIGRYFRWQGRSGLSAEVYFVIEDDGSVSDIQVLRPSGDFAFDLEARAAIEHAGKRRAFGALPEGFGAERLPVAFYFEPAR